MKILDDFFSRLGLEDNKECILSLNKDNKDTLDLLYKVREKLEEFYLRDKKSIMGDIEVTPDTDEYSIKYWVEGHTDYKLGSNKTFWKGKLGDYDRVIVKALIDRHKELIETSEGICKKMVDLMVISREIGINV